MLNHLKNLIIGDNSPKTPGRRLSISGSIEKGDQVHHDDHHENKHSIFSPEKQCKKEDEHSKKEHESYHFVDYTVQPDDTLDGIAISYDLNPWTIRRDNDLSSDLVYKGQVLKIRVVNDPEPEKDKETKEEAENVEESDKIENCSDPHVEIKDLDKCIIQYCTSIGDIKGNIRFDGSMLTFTPIELVDEKLKHQDNTGDSHIKAVSKKEYQDKNLAQWKTEINIGDLDECHLMIVPSVDVEDHFDVNQEYEMDYLLQVVLHGHGERSLGKYLNDLFSGMKKKRVPYACVHFKIKGKSEEGHVASNQQKHSMAHQIQAKIMALKKSIDEGKFEVSKELTQVPYFEFLFDKFEKNDAELLRKLSRKETAFPELTEEETAKILAGEHEEESKEEIVRKGSIVPSVKRMMIPKIIGESQILNLEQFTELINCAPELYQTLDWQMIYSTAVDGTSYHNLLRRTQSEYPTLIVIKDENDFVFGAYCSNEIWFSDQFYGNGETFLYTFRDLNEITTFYWSKKNNLILFVSEEGIMFGSKPHYGLWINNELTHGRSFECETFSSQMLSYKNDFQIIKLEVWGVIDPFATERKEKQSFSESEEYPGGF